MMSTMISDELNNNFTYKGKSGHWHISYDPIPSPFEPWLFSHEEDYSRNTFRAATKEKVIEMIEEMEQYDN